MFEDGQTFEQFLKDYYAIGPEGYLNYMGRLQGMTMEEVRESAELRKILTYNETNYYESGYMMDAQLQFSWLTDLYKLFDKRPITSVGLSFDHIDAHGLSTRAVKPLGATAIFSGPTEPTVTPIANLASPVMGVELSHSLTDYIHEKVPGVLKRGQNVGWEYLKNKLAPIALWNYIDTWLGGYATAANAHGVETPAADQIECLDRMISTRVESGAATHVSLATDGDVYWDGSGAVAIRVDRDQTTANWFDAQLKLPAAAGTEEAYQILEEVDDLMKAAKPYSERKRYIGITTQSTLNKMQDEYGGQVRSLEGEVKAAIGINGVKTAEGHEIGFPVQAIKTCGLTIPIFTSEALPLENSIYTTPTAGHLYIVDLDVCFIRVDMPMTYLETGFGVEMLHQDRLRSRAFLFAKQNLICTKPAACAALKWIKA